MAQPEHNGERKLLTRREAIAGAGVLGLGAGLYFVLRDGGETARQASRTTTASTSNSAMCVLTPEQTEGPYYIADSLVRRDVTEDRVGVPLELRLDVQDATNCEPIRDATVEIWHCDALGAYSGFSDGADDETFLRGAQKSAGAGKVTFQTIYPGWYRGRTTHIHVKVHAGGEVVHTGQLYFDETVTNAVYGEKPYASHGEPTTTNASDGIYGDGGRQSKLALSRDGKGYVGRLTLGVRAAS
jgi:protocatechuate 3,4-dioxygenase beta subunit